MKKIWVILSIALVIVIGYALHLAKDSKTITIGFTGDVMIGRLVNEIIAQKGYAYPWGNLLPLLKQTDLTIINLETTLTTSTQKVPSI